MKILKLIYLKIKEEIESPFFPSDLEDYDFE